MKRLCAVCGSITKNKARYRLILYNPHQRELPVCRYCLEDFVLMGSRKFQAVKL